MPDDGALTQNPFRLLGLSATATTAEIRRRYEELAVRVDLGATDASLTKDHLRAIKQALDDPVERTRSSLFWLHSPRELVDPDIDPHDSERLASAIQRLKSQAGRPTGRQQSIALHDLAVLMFLAYLERHDGFQYLETGLGAWAETTEGNEFWTYFRERVSEVGDQRLTDAAVERMRNELPAAILEPLARNTAALLSSGGIASAADLIQAMRQSGLPESTVSSAIESATAPVRTKIQSGLRLFDEVNAKVESDSEEAVGLRKRADEAESVLIEQVLAPTAQLSGADPILEDALLYDEVARASRELAVSYANELGDWESAYVFAQESLAFARSPHLLAQLAGEQAIVCSQYHVAEADRASNADDLASAAAHMELALPYAQDQAESREWTQITWTLKRRIGAEADVRVEKNRKAILARLESNATALKRRVQTIAGLAPPSDSAAEPTIDVPLSAQRHAHISDSAAEPTIDQLPSSAQRTSGGDGYPSGPERTTAVRSPRKRRWWMVPALASLALIGLILVATEMSGNDTSSSSQDSAAAQQSLAASAAQRRAARQEQARERARERAEKREARRRARERRRREAQRRARATRFSCFRFDEEVNRARADADTAKKKLDALRGNPAAYNAFLPDANALIGKYNDLIRRKCDPR